MHDVYIAEGNMNGERFAKFVQDSLLPVLMPFNGTNPRSVVIMDNAGIHYVEEIANLIETQAGAKLCYLLHTLQILILLRGCLAKLKVS